MQSLDGAAERLQEATGCGESDFSGNHDNLLASVADRCCSQSWSSMEVVERIGSQGGSTGATADGDGQVWRGSKDDV